MLRLEKNYCVEARYSKIQKPFFFIARLDLSLKKGVKLESIRVSDFAITLITDKLIVFMHLKSSILYANLERF